MLIIIELFFSNANDFNAYDMDNIYVLYRNVDGWHENW